MRHVAILVMHEKPAGHPRAAEFGIGIGFLFAR
jgi:hypothetical protein